MDEEAERPGYFVRKLFISHEYSDFTLVCEGRLYRLHKAIVCPQSDVFAAMLRSKFKEGRENSIHLPEEDARVVHCMVRYLYCFDYEVKDQIAESGFESVDGALVEPLVPTREELVNEEAVNGEPPTADADKHAAPMHALLLHARMYIIAEAYAIQGLKEVALRNFNSALSYGWDPAAFVQAADLAYTWTRDGDYELRESVVRGAKMHGAILTDDTWKPALQGMGPFMYDVARSMLPKTTVAPDYIKRSSFRRS